jgi:ABC-type glutathione transport system ATPase component
VLSHTSTNAVDDISFEVQPGEIPALVGTSGCGKTTTLKMIKKPYNNSGDSGELQPKQTAQQFLEHHE